MKEALAKALVEREGLKEQGGSVGIGSGRDEAFHLNSHSMTFPDPKT